MTIDFKDPKLSITTFEDNPELIETLHAIALDQLDDAVVKLTQKTNLLDTDTQVLCALISAYVDFGQRVIGPENMSKMLDEFNRRIRTGLIKERE